MAVVHTTDHWLVTTAPEPSPGTLHHWVMSPRLEHPADLTDLSPDARAEFWPVLDWLRSAYGLTYLCLGVRSWDHGVAHVMVADGTPAEGVRFDMTPPGFH